MSKKRTDGRTSKGTYARGVSGNPKGRPASAREPMPSVTDPRFDVGALMGSPAMLQHRAKLLPKGQDKPRRKDDWRNPTTGQGVHGRDKRMGAFFAPATLSFDQLREVWQGDDLAAVAVETIPKQARRPGYDISISDAEDQDSEGDLAAQLMNRLKQLGADEKIETAGQYARAYGGGAILLGVNDKQKDFSQPLVLDNVVSLDWLTVLEARECIPLYAYGDPRAPRYGHPEIYQITSRSVLPSRSGNYGAATMNVHESRLLIFDGIRVSRYQNTAARGGWGESILVRIWRVLRDFNTAWANAGVLISDFAQTVIKMAGLWASLADDSESAFEDRLAAMDYGRSTINAITIDAEDDFIRQTGSLTGLPDLLEKFAVRLAAACGMPLTLLFGTSPAGMNATGESDIRSFYDRVDEYRQHRIDPALRRLIQILFRTLGSKQEPAKWGIEHRPLWQPEPKEVSGAMLTQAQADTAWIQAGVLSPEEVAKAHWGSGKYNPHIVVDFSAREAQEQAAASPVAPAGAPGADPNDPLAGAAPDPNDPLAGMEEEGAAADNDPLAGADADKANDPLAEDDDNLPLPPAIDPLADDAEPDPVERDNSTNITDPDKLPPNGDDLGVNANVAEPVVNEDDNPTPHKDALAAVSARMDEAIAAVADTSEIGVARALTLFTRIAGQLDGVLSLYPRVDFDPDQERTPDGKFGSGGGSGGGSEKSGGKGPALFKQVNPSPSEHAVLKALSKGNNSVTSISKATGLSKNEALSAANRLRMSIGKATGQSPHEVNLAKHAKEMLVKSKPEAAPAKPPAPAKAPAAAPAKPALPPGVNEHSFKGKLIASLHETVAKSGEVKAKTGAALSKAASRHAAASARSQETGARLKALQSQVAFAAAKAHGFHGSPQARERALANYQRLAGRLGNAWTSHQAASAKTESARVKAFAAHEAHQSASATHERAHEALRTLGVAPARHDTAGATPTGRADSTVSGLLALIDETSVDFDAVGDYVTRLDGQVDMLAALYPDEDERLDYSPDQPRDADGKFGSGGGSPGGGGKAAGSGSGAAPKMVLNKPSLPANVHRTSVVGKQLTILHNTTVKAGRVATAAGKKAATAEKQAAATKTRAEKAQALAEKKLQAFYKVIDSKKGAKGTPPTTRPRLRTTKPRIKIDLPVS